MDDKERLAKYELSIKSLKDILAAQGSDENWNYDPYMHGMANGMILALSLFIGDPYSEVESLTAPDVWLKDQDKQENLTGDK